MKQKVTFASFILVLMVCSFASADLTDGIVAHWKFDEGLGDTAFDSANGNEGNLINDPCWVEGKIGNYALDFDGITNYVQVPDAPNLDGMNQLTLSAWIKKDNIGTWGVIINKYNGQTGPSDSSYLIRVDVSGNIEFIYSLGGSYVIKESAPAINPATWHHIAGVYTGLEGIIYIDGNEVPLSRNDHDPGGPINTSEEKVLIGCMRILGNLSKFFGGTIEDARIYNRALSAEEIEQLYLGTNPELTGIEIEGPNEVAEDSQVQFKAIAHYNNSSTKDVTDSAIWSVEPDIFAQIDTSGLLTTQKIYYPEDITIHAQYTEDSNTFSDEKDTEIYAVCPSGSALEFDGQDDYVTLPDNNPVWLPQHDFTLSCWVFCDRPPGELETILDLNRGGSGSYSNALGYFITRIATGQLAFSMTSTTVTLERLDSQGILLDNTWYHIVAVRNSTNQSIYIDAQLDNSRTSSPDPIKFVGNWDDDKVNIGRYTTTHGPQFYFLGKIDEVAVYNRALDANEVADIYGGGVIIDSNLVGYWDFYEGQGQVAGDSANDNDGYLGSDPCNPDNSDPCWVDSGAPLIPCSKFDLIERNLGEALQIKDNVLDELSGAMEREMASEKLLNELRQEGGLDDLRPNEFNSIRKKLTMAQLKEIISSQWLSQSVDLLEEASTELGIDTYDDE